MVYVPAYVPATLLPIQLPVNMPGEAAENGTSYWALNTYMWDPEAAPAPAFSLAQSSAIVVIWGVKQWWKIFVSTLS